MNSCYEQSTSLKKRETQKLQLTSTTALDEISLLYNSTCIATERDVTQQSRVKSPNKANTDLHDGGIILTNKTSTSDPL